MENTVMRKTVVDHLQEMTTTKTDLLPEGVDEQIYVVTKYYVQDILPDLLKEGLSLKDILEDTDSMWDYVVELIGDLEKDVQDLFKTNLDGDFSLWSDTYNGLKDRFVMEMSKVEC